MRYPKYLFLIILIVNIYYVHGTLGESSLPINGRLKFVIYQGDELQTSIAFFIRDSLSNLGINIRLEQMTSNDYFNMLGSYTAEWDVTLFPFEDNKFVPHNLQSYSTGNILGKLFYSNLNVSYIDLLIDLESSNPEFYYEKIRNYQNQHMEYYLPDLPIAQPYDYLGISDNTHMVNESTLDFSVKGKPNLMELLTIGIYKEKPEILNFATEELMDPNPFSSTDAIHQLRYGPLLLHTSDGRSYPWIADTYNIGVYNKSFNQEIQSGNHTIQINQNAKYSDGSQITGKDFLNTVRIFQLGIIRQIIDVPSVIDRISSISYTNKSISFLFDDPLNEDFYGISKLFPTPSSLIELPLHVEINNEIIEYNALSDTYSPFSSVEWKKYITSGVSSSLMDLTRPISGQNSIDNIQLEMNEYFWKPDDGIILKNNDTSGHNAESIYYWNNKNLNETMYDFGIDISTNSHLGTVDKFLEEKLDIIYITDIYGDDQLIYKSIKEKHKLFPYIDNKVYRLIFNSKFEDNFDTRKAIASGIDLDSLINYFDEYVISQKSPISSRFTTFYTTEYEVPYNPEYALSELRSYQLTNTNEMVITINNDITEQTDKSNTNLFGLQYYLIVLIIIIKFGKTKSNKGN